MKLFHGGIVPVEMPRIIQNEAGRDFGAAFYTSDIKAQAERWALRRRTLAIRNGDINAKAIVSVFDYDEEFAEKSLSVLKFPEVSLEWLDLIVTCRADSRHSHGFDLVTGKVADDNVGETVAYVIANIMRKEDALARLKFQKINNQLAFCTEKALACLKYETCYTVEAQID